MSHTSASAAPLSSTVDWTMPRGLSEVEPTDLFGDIQGARMPSPRFATRAKLRWDDEFLYVAAEMEEPQVWANQTQHDSIVYLDNDFEVFVDPDGSTHWYKEFEINAIATTFNLLLDKPYLDGGAANYSGWDVPGMRAAVNVVGGRVNAPGSGNRGWTVELALPLASLAYNEEVAVPPAHGDRWRINFSRVE
eukprot:Opistho-1_new@17256